MAFRRQFGHGWRCLRGGVLVWALGLICSGAAAGDTERPRRAGAGPGSSGTAKPPLLQPHPSQLPLSGEHDTFERRRGHIVHNFVRELARDGLGDPRARLEPRAFRHMAAGLFALQAGHPERANLAALPGRIERHLALIRRTTVAGTDGSGHSPRRGDYDFVMKEMVSLLYRFRDARELLTDDAAFSLLDRGLADFAGTHLEPELTFEVGLPIVGNVLRFPETENHVLMIYSSAYLANRWVVDNPRGDPRLRTGRYRDTARFIRAARHARTLLLEVCGRIMRSGFWEVNARPYQALSAHALMNLHAFSPSKRLRIAAHNALDYLATKFAFQSIGMRRFSPYRRNARYAPRLGLYENDGIPFMFGTLEGGASWPGNFIDTGNAAGHALWAALLDYRVHPAIRSYITGARGHYWARMMTRFSNEDYHIGRAARYRDAGRDPVEFVPELYFKTPAFLNSAGGRYNRFPIAGDTLLPSWGVRDSDFLSRPLALLTRKHYGHFRSRGQFDMQVMNMPGERAYWKSDNLGVYKGFAYGYRHDGDSRHLDWAVSLPLHYRTHLHHEDGRSEFRKPGSRASFAFIDLTQSRDAGFYLVLGRVSKSAPGRSFRKYARGFWEVVPGHRFPDAASLKRAVMHANPAGNFTDGHDDGELHYLYQMTTGETLELNARLGADRKHCDNAIRAVWPKGSRPERDPPLPLSSVLVDRCNARAIELMPLLDVQELDRDYNFTGHRVAFAPGDGQLSIRDPQTGAHLYLDSRDPYHPVRKFK